MFEATETRMAAFESLAGQRLPPEMFTVVRLVLDGLDGLVEDGSLALSGPLDERLARALLKTAALLLRENPDGLFSWVSGDEVAVLLDLDTFLDRRDPRSLLSRFSGQASAKASLTLGVPVAFDCKLYGFPSEEQASDFFAWRQEVRVETTLHAYCESVLIDNGADPAHVEKILDGMDREDKREVLANNDVEVASVPAWQVAGTGLYWAERSGNGPALVVDAELPTGEAYRGFLQRFLE